MVLKERVMTTFRTLPSEIFYKRNVSEWDAEPGVYKIHHQHAVRFLMKFVGKHVSRVSRNSDHAVWKRQDGREKHCQRASKSIMETI